MSHFFTPENLTRLRELALGEIAHVLDRRRRESTTGQAASGSERVMVCLSSRSPNAAAMLRKGSRLASRFNAPWYAVYIQTPRENMERVDAATHRNVTNMLDLAQKLGGIAIPFKGSDVVSTIAAFVNDYHITHIVMGRSQRPWYRLWFGQSLLDRLLREIKDVDVLVVDTV